MKSGRHRPRSPCPADRAATRAVALVVLRPDLHLVGQGQFLVEILDHRNGCTRAGEILRAVQPSRVRARPVLQIVARDGRAARVRRRFPAHRQAGLAVLGQPYFRRARRARHLGKVLDVNGYLNGGVGPAVAHFHRYRIGRRRFVIVDDAGLGLDLASVPVDGEIPRVRAFQAVGQRIVVVVGRLDRFADVFRRSRSDVTDGFGQASGIGVGGKLRHDIWGGVAGVVSVTGAGLRPVTVALGVGRPHMDLIGGVRGETGNCRARAGHVLRPVCPASAHALPVLQVVAGNGRAARVRWRGPAYRQARCAVQDRRHHRRGGR